MIISISGVPGSGKTSVGKILAEHFGVPFYSVGGLRGKMAMERGISINELNTLGETDPTTDTSVDEYQRELGTKEQAFVIEGRLSWHFIPHSYKVLLNCDPREAARRIYQVRSSADHGRNDEPAYTSIEDAQAELEKRTASDVLRYQKYYGLDYRDPSHFDLVVDTTVMNGPEETAKAIIEAVRTK